MKLKVLALFLCISALPVSAQRTVKRPLSPADIDAIATLLKLEDLRQFDAAALARIAASAHPEVRRRAAQTIGRIVSDQARPLLVSLRSEKDPEVLATVVWATGQQKDTSAIGWLGDLLNGAATPAVVAQEAAQALGKIRKPEAEAETGAALEAFLKKAPLTAPPAVVGEALLALGRLTSKRDLSAITRWSTSRNVDLRWRAAWALFRLKDPLAVPELMRMSADASPDVRFWAVRGLTAPIVAQSTITPDDAAARLRQAYADPDRRVRTEAIRALMLYDARTHVGYDDDASFATLMDALGSSDYWIAVSVAEAAGRYAGTARAAAVTAKLLDVTAPGKSLGLRAAAATQLAALSPADGKVLADALAQTDSTTARSESARALRAIAAADAARAGTPPAAPAGRGGRGNGQPRPERQARPDAEYRALVTRWIVPDYIGAPKPHVVFDTPRGPIEFELYPGDAPFGVEYLYSVIETKDIVGSEFPRVVPNFVDQEGPIRSTALPLRDEVSRRGLARANLAWASAGLDTGRPGYTFGNTPQPHNEGDFTALGRVVKGFDAMNAIELGDKITGARVIILKPS